MFELVLETIHYMGGTTGITKEVAVALRSELENLFSNGQINQVQFEYGVRRLEAATL
jgi:hypothetical protein